MTVPIGSARSALDALARLDPSTFPMISVYLNLEADAHGKDNYAMFVRKELPDRVRNTFMRPDAREGAGRDLERIRKYCASEIPPEANGIAIFACEGRAGFFEALLLDVPVDRHRVAIAPTPFLYPVALLLDQYPPHAVVVSESHVANIYVFGLGRTLGVHSVDGQHIRRSSGGGLGQMRYQRHVKKLQADHARELVQLLERIVRDEGIEHLVLAGDDVNVPLVKNELSKELEAKVVDVIRINLESQAPEHVVMSAAADALDRYTVRNNRELVARLMDDYRAGGQATAGLEETARAIDLGQVSELYLTVPGEAGQPNEDTANELVVRALRTSARARFIKDPVLLSEVEGIAARLRYRAPVQRGSE